MAQKLNYLIVTDIHYQLQAIDKLKLRIKDKDIKLDAIICLGDIVNVDHFDNSDQSKDELEMVAVMKKLSEINPIVYYIPGNHDPKLCFKEFNSSIDFIKKFDLDPQCFINVHEQTTNIAPNLILMGMGGSVDSILKEKVYWLGFPYNEAKILEKFNKLKDQIKEESQIILITHQGPSNSYTTRVAVEEDSLLESGSDSINQIAQEIQPLIHFHGHTHAGWGLSRNKHVITVNPGALKYERSVILQLQKEDDKYEIKTIEFLSK
ncbi:Metallo-dependent phosphatase [Neoconidiobolus thromboides FSU 785]|nr:Metallo-dependent phosphatase [Neoconidiobolus thromboides FSU 785]